MGVKLKVVKPYQDSNTMWHDKPTVNGIPSSNNGYIYTAYSKYLVPNSTNKDKVLNNYIKCVKSLDPVSIDRVPGKTEPPFSKDEVIGCVSLGLLTDNQLENSSYTFCNINEGKHLDTSFKSILGAFKALWDIRKEDRNHFWENKIEETYPLAFRLSPWDIYYVKRFYGKSTSLFYDLMFYLNFFLVLLKGDKSSRMLVWLQLKDLDSKLIRLVPENKWINDYFDENHPFRRS